MEPLSIFFLGAFAGMLTGVGIVGVVVSFVDQQDFNRHNKIKYKNYERRTNGTKPVKNY